MADVALEALVDAVRAAAAARTPLRIRGGGSKDFYGERWAETLAPLETGALAGISAYEPSELVATVRAGTPLAELEAALAGQGQCLPFEPPRFAAGGTVGGMVAAGLAGPSRAAAGGVRDFILGATLVDGRGQVLSFGGQVMKNVAGYDVSRVLAGSLGVLGVIAEVSLKVLPLPAATATLRFEWDQARALQQLARWGGQPLPISASAWWEGVLVLRLAGAAAAVQAAQSLLGGERVEPGAAAAFWRGLRDHDDEFFAQAREAVAGGATLWRLAMPQTAPVLSRLPGSSLVEWGGAQRWLCSTEPAPAVRDAVRAAGGHATRWLGGDGTSGGVFTRPAAPLMRVHERLKKAFDPEGILNPGRLYPGL